MVLLLFILELLMLVTTFLLPTIYLILCFKYSLFRLMIKSFKEAVTESRDYIYSICIILVFCPWTIDSGNFHVGVVREVQLVDMKQHGVG